MEIKNKFRSISWLLVGITVGLMGLSGTAPDIFPHDTIQIGGYILVGISAICFIIYRLIDWKEKKDG